MDAVVPVNFGAALVEGVDRLVDEGRVGVRLRRNVVRAQDDAAVVLKAAHEVARAVLAGDTGRVEGTAGTSELC